MTHLVPCPQRLVLLLGDFIYKKAFYHLQYLISFNFTFSLSKVQERAISLDKSNSSGYDETDILGTPFAEKSGMARSSTMPLDESGKQVISVDFV